MAQQHGNSQLQKCRKMIDDLKNKIKGVFLERIDEDAQPLRDHTKRMESKDVPVVQMRQRKLLRGHFGKIYALDVSTKGDIATGAQDEKIIIWGLFSGLKKEIISPQHSSIMSVEFSIDGAYVACGGLDNICAIYKITEADSAKCNLSAHEGYISRCQFLNDSEILTASGDGTCILWDIESKVPKCKFSDHKGDIMGLDALPQSNDSSKSSNLVLSCSTDGYVKLWDFRVAERNFSLENAQNKTLSPRKTIDANSLSLTERFGTSETGCVASFYGHEGEINCVKWFPSYDYTFASGGDDGTIRLWDIRAMRQMNVYTPLINDASGEDMMIRGRVPCVNSISFTHSGTLLFGGFDEAPYCVGFNTVTGEPYSVLTHEEDVSSLRVSTDGYCVVTGSWDTMARVWA